MSPTAPAHTMNAGDFLRSIVARPHASDGTAAASRAGVLNCFLPQRYQRLCVAAVCALPAPRHKFKQSAPQTTTNVRRLRMRIMPRAGGPIASGCPLAVDRTAHDHPFGFSLQDGGVLSASNAVRCARTGTSIFPHQIGQTLQPSLQCDESHEIGAGHVDRGDFQDRCLEPRSHLSVRHSIASGTHPSQALRSRRLSPQESLKISMRCSPFGKTLDWLGGRARVS
jgi:hypothetical protein